MKTSYALVLLFLIFCSVCASEQSKNDLTKNFLEILKSLGQQRAVTSYHDQTAKGESKRDFEERKYSSKEWVKFFLDDTKIQREIKRDPQNGYKLALEWCREEEGQARPCYEAIAEYLRAQEKS